MRTSDVKCPYCDGYAKMVMGGKIYPHRPDLRGKFFYECEPCKAYVGTHAKTLEPLGRLANYKLRRMKNAAHAAFDQLWKYGHMSRTAAYAWLSGVLKLSKEETHIGMFDEATCARVVEVSRAELRRIRDENKAIHSGGTA